jgi:hypothetical protein
LAINALLLRQKSVVGVFGAVHETVEITERAVRAQLAFLFDLLLSFNKRFVGYGAKDEGCEVGRSTGGMNKRTMGHGNIRV